eukprot:scaffold3050_cov99-Isochrysis_galbana.AAC.7
MSGVAALWVPRGPRRAETRSTRCRVSEFPRLQDDCQSRWPSAARACGACRGGGVKAASSRRVDFRCAAVTCSSFHVKSYLK